jgi:hypothetical protein
MGLLHPQCPPVEPQNWGHYRFSKPFLEKLSEKGYEQRSKRGFGWFTEGEMDRNAPLWLLAGLRCRLPLRLFGQCL